MPLRKSPTITPALLAANRQNAQKSTGPRTRGGKARSRLNRLQRGGRSREFRDFFEFLVFAEPCQVGAAARAYFEAHDVSHPLYWEMAQLVIQADIETGEAYAALSAKRHKRK